MEDTSRSDDDDTTLILADKLRRMAITSSPNDQFFGKSSGAMLVQTAFELKNEFAGDEDRFDGPGKPAVNAKRTEFWDAKPVR
jgi:hypothetical protein